ncbi:hypothetical protein [Edaphobacter modestus]|uniref:Uncharacterized protein n=1 Tax=Edaphobacter modestus TaxID=388466 RepID=A0A4Q7YZT1_9BACT|nr:hypothetical protein [Edaphobacter modestus]RZU42709.1 hypothetical protein BDD14_4301 [Edaphobacter modestus]
MGTLRWTDGHGKEVSRQTNLTINIEDFKGTPGYPWLVIAANRHLSVDVLEMWLRVEGENYERSRSWIARRRWMFEDPNNVNKPGSKPNADGKDARAIAIMRENPKMSVRALARLLSKSGIRRGKDWVLRHRCD